MNTAALLLLLFAAPAAVVSYDAPIQRQGFLEARCANGRCHPLTPAAPPTGGAPSTTAAPTTTTTTTVSTTTTTTSTVFDPSAGHTKVGKYILLSWSGNVFALNDGDRVKSRQLAESESFEEFGQTSALFFWKSDEGPTYRIQSATDGKWWTANMGANGETNEYYLIPRLPEEITADRALDFTLYGTKSFSGNKYSSTQITLSTTVNEGERFVQSNAANGQVWTLVNLDKSAEAVNASARFSVAVLVETEADINMDHHKDLVLVNSKLKNRYISWRDEYDKPYNNNAIGTSGVKKSGHDWLAELDFPIARTETTSDELQFFLVSAYKATSDGRFGAQEGSPHPENRSGIYMKQGKAPSIMSVKSGSFDGTHWKVTTTQDRNNEKLLYVDELDGSNPRFTVWGDGKDDSGAGAMWAFLRFFRNPWEALGLPDDQRFG